MYKRVAFILAMVAAIALCFFISAANRRITLHSQYFTTREINAEIIANESPINAFMNELEAKQDSMTIPKDIEDSEVGRLLLSKETKPHIYMENDRFYIFYTYKSFGKKYIDIIAGKVEPLQNKMAYQEEILETQPAEQKVSVDGRTVQVGVSSKPTGRTQEKLSNQLEIKLNENKRMRLIYDAEADALKYINDKVKIRIPQIDFIAFTAEKDAVLKQCTTVSTEQKQKDSVELSTIQSIRYEENEVRYMDVRKETYVKTTRNQDNILTNELEHVATEAKGILARFKVDSGKIQILVADMTAQFIFNRGSEAEIIYQYSLECRY